MQHALGIHGAGISAEQNGRLVLAPIVTHPGMARFGDALGDGTADLKTLGQLSRRKDLDLDTPVGEEFHFIGKGLGANFH